MNLENNFLNLELNSVKNTNSKVGYASMYLGCMYSGKTTSLVHEVSLYAEITNSPGLLINHIFDNRDLQNKISSHNPLIKKIPSNIQTVFATQLSDLSETDLDKYTVIGIDEAQFFLDVYDTVLKWIESGKYIVMSGLSGTYKKELFGDLYRLIPHADKIQFLHAICKECINESKNTILTPELLNTMKAPFTKKISGDLNKTVEVGSTEIYVPTCRKHYI